MDEEEEILEILRKHPRGAPSEKVMESFSGSQERMVDVTNTLSDKGLVEFVTINKKLYFRAVNVEEVTKTKGFTPNEKIIYNLIKAEKSKGIWIKDITHRSGLHTNIVKDCIKSLEKNKFIKAVKSVKTTKKLYMLFEYEASEDVTGGAFYTDQELDEAFINELCTIIYRFICKKSLPENRDEVYPPTHSGYPTVSQVTKYLDKSKVTPVRLTNADVEMLMNRLVYEDKIVVLPKRHMNMNVNSMSSEEEVGSDDEMVIGEYATSVYKAVREINDAGKVLLSIESCWTDIPCGKCPVASFCRAGGPVNPESCVYYDEWLGKLEES
ncbi:34-kDa subunit of RNA polymerase III (C) [Irineochytrium annulatum]|nr:34-kDa subunit of RNA polymerase III (C) [Irineochytrium annulatum]